MPSPAKSAFACAVVVLSLLPIVAWAQTRPPPRRWRLLTEAGAPWTLAPPSQLAPARPLGIVLPREQSQGQPGRGIEWMFAIDLGPELTVSARGGDAISSSGRLFWSMGGHRRVARYFWDALDRDAAGQPDGQLVAPSLVGLMVGY